jgi:hypothetical protein
MYLNLMTNITNKSSKLVPRKIDKSAASISKGDGVAKNRLGAKARKGDELKGCKGVPADKNRKMGLARKIFVLTFKKQE